MEFNRVAISIFSVLVTLAITLGAFAYKTGVYNNEVKNIKEQQLIIKEDLVKQINIVEVRKADADVVNMLIKRIDKNIEENTIQHQHILDKLDRLIEKQIGE